MVDGCVLALVLCVSVPYSWSSPLFLSLSDSKIPSDSTISVISEFGIWPRDLLVSLAQLVGSVAIGPKAQV